MRTLLAAAKGIRSFLSRGKQRYTVSWSAPIGHTQPQNSLFPAMLNKRYHGKHTGKDRGKYELSLLQAEQDGFGECAQRTWMGREFSEEPGSSRNIGSTAKRIKTADSASNRARLFTVTVMSNKPPPMPASTLTQILGNSRYSVKLIMRLPPPLSSAPTSRQAISRRMTA